MGLQIHGGTLNFVGN